VICFEVGWAPGDGAGVASGVAGAGVPAWAGAGSVGLAGEAAGASDLDGFFALHPALAGLMPLWQAGELGFAHAVSTPYRDKRSHFDGQDLLEAGMPGLGQGRDGWLNRMLQQMPGVTGQTAYALGHEDMLLLRGAATVANWAPDAALRISPQAERLAGLVMHDDPLFRAALEEALLAFPGCAVVISHDRWFLDRIATHILAFEGDSQVTWFEGNYADYEADRHRRLGTDADQPHRLKYRRLSA
jgi:uncharacterized protein (DUF1501 family)